MKRLILTFVVACLMASPTLAWQEGGSNDWYYVDASYGGYHNSVPLVIEINGNSASGQTFYVGDTITISCDLHAVAQSCGGDGNGAYTEWLLAVNGPSGPDSTGDWNYDHSSGCAVADEDTTLTITYPLTAAGVHTIDMSSYAAVSQYWTDVADDYAAASLTFEVVISVDIDIKPGSYPNSINLKSKGVVPVAVLTTPDFDATTVDPATVEFAGAAPLRWAWEDVDGDGDVDLLLHFKTQELNLDENSTEATLTGNLKSELGGTPIQGTDEVRIVPRKK
jgi:hypothetical protein